MCERVDERVRPVEGAAQQERPAVQHGVGEVEMGDDGAHDTREVDGGIGGSRARGRVFISKDGSKASESSIERFRVGGMGKMSAAIPGEVEVALGVRERHCRGRRGERQQEHENSE